jgi:pimeloyl-ACP methyl ester carboxylesterase
VTVEFEPIIGRYARFEIEGKPQRVYFEEAGQGIPLVCLHTAGTDTRQWRHLMTDETVTRNFRVLAFDMPWHGKSYPPAGFEKEEYRLTTKGFIAAIRAFCAALELDQPVVMGCSIGGRIVLDLAAGHAKEFGALIGVQCSNYHKPWYDSSWLNRPDVHGGEVCAALVSGMMAPQSPTATVQETLWQYKQGGPGVFKGDLYFYGTEGDFRDRMHLIDPEACPIYLLTGEYDYSATPEDTLRTAAAIKGAYVEIMKEVGHFPMSENPAQFRRYLLPVLEQIHGRLGTPTAERQKAAL